MTEGQKERPSLTSHQSVQNLDRDVSHNSTSPRSQTCWQNGQSFKPSAAKEARSALEHLCAGLHHPQPLISTGASWTHSTHRGPMGSRRPQTTHCACRQQHVCLDVCSRNGRKTREKAASNHLTWLKDGEKFRGQERFEKLWSKKDVSPAVYFHPSWGW